MPFIYSLSCPNNGDVRYIGRTVKPKDRLAQHLSIVKHGRCKNKRLSEWILSLLINNQKPNYTLLIECEYNQLSFYERHFINNFFHYGKLLNIELMYSLHDEIDYNYLRNIAKTKKIRYKTIASALNCSYGSVAGYLTGQRGEMCLEKAKAMQEFILSS